MTVTSAYSMEESRTLLALHIRSEKKLRRVDQHLKRFYLMKNNPELFLKRKNHYAQAWLDYENSCFQPDEKKLKWFRKLKQAPLFDTDDTDKIEHLNWYSWNYLIDYFYDDELFCDGPVDPHDPLTIKLHCLDGNSRLKQPSTAKSRERNYRREIKEALTPFLKSNLGCFAEEAYRHLQENYSYWQDIEIISFDLDVNDWPSNKKSICMTFHDKSFKDGKVTVKRSTFENWIPNFKQDVST